MKRWNMVSNKKVSKYKAKTGKIKMQKNKIRGNFIIPKIVHQTRLLLLLPRSNVKQEKKSELALLCSNHHRRRHQTKYIRDLNYYMHALHTTLRLNWLSCSSQSALLCSSTSCLFLSPTLIRKLINCLKSNQQQLSEAAWCASLSDPAADAFLLNKISSCFDLILH